MRQLTKNQIPNIEMPTMPDIIGIIFDAIRWPNFPTKYLKFATSDDQHTNFSFISFFFIARGRVASIAAAIAAK